MPQAIVSAPRLKARNETLDVVRVERRAEHERLVDVVDALLVASRSSPRARCGLSVKNSAGIEPLAVGGIDDAPRARRRACREERRRRRRAMASRSRRNAAGISRVISFTNVAHTGVFVRGAIDEAIRAAGELIEMPEHLRIRRVRPRAIEIGAGAPIQLHELLHLRRAYLGRLRALSSSVVRAVSRRACGRR